ncbi:MAG: type III pantothenate kinase [Gemmatimonadota bacterium]
MILALDVGNTETVVGLFHDETLHAHWRVSTRPERTVDEMGLLLRALIREAGADDTAVSGAGIASVVPPLTPVIAEACRRYLHADVVVIDAASGLPIRLDVEEPLTVGADRIVNTLAAARLYAADTIAVDFGTATTFDCIGADGVFRGGVITPGIQTGAETLIRRTAKLPRVDIDQPHQVMGRRTETAIQSGIFFSAVDAVDGIVARIREEWGAPDILVVATGGLASLVAPHCRSIDRIEPFLTLHGIRLAFEHLRG